MPGGEQKNAGKGKGRGRGRGYVTTGMRPVDEATRINIHELLLDFQRSDATGDLCFVDSTPSKRVIASLCEGPWPCNILHWPGEWVCCLAISRCFPLALPLLSDSDLFCRQVHEWNVSCIREFCNLLSFLLVKSRVLIAVNTMVWMVQSSPFLPISATMRGQLYMGNAGSMASSPKAKGEVLYFCAPQPADLLGNGIDHLCLSTQSSISMFKYNVGHSGKMLNNRLPIKISIHSYIFTMCKCILPFAIAKKLDGISKKHTAWPFTCVGLPSVIKLGNLAASQFLHRH